MKTIIEITEDDVLVKSENNGVQSVKHTTPNSLKAALSVGEFEESPFMPAGDGFIKYMNKGRKEVYFYISPPKRLDVKINEGSGRIRDCKVETPHMLWVLHFTKQSDTERRLTGSSVFGAIGPIRTMETQLFEAPFPNVYDDQKICWGGYSPVFRGVESIPSIVSQFFMAPFNYDLTGGIDSSYLDEDEFEDQGFGSTIYLIRYMDHMIQNESHPGEYKFPTEVLQEFADLRQVIRVARESLDR